MIIEQLTIIFLINSKREKGKLKDNIWKISDKMLCWMGYSFSPSMVHLKINVKNVLARWAHRPKMTWKTSTVSHFYGQLFELNFLTSTDIFFISILFTLLAVNQTSFSLLKVSFVHMPAILILNSLGREGVCLHHFSHSVIYRPLNLHLHEEKKQKHPL